MRSKVLLSSEIRIKEENEKSLLNKKGKFEKSITTVNKYLSDMKNKIGSLEFAQNKNVFPTPYPKWIRLHIPYDSNNNEVIDSDHIPTQIKVVCDKREHMHGWDEIDNALKKGKKLCLFWEEYKKGFEEELIAVEDDIKKVRADIYHLKKELIEHDKPDEEENNKEGNKAEFPDDGLEKEEKQQDDNSRINENGLRKPKYGELKELCNIYAENLDYELEETPGKEQVKYVFKQITEYHKLKTTLETVAQVFRKLGYCRRHPS